MRQMIFFIPVLFCLFLVACEDKSTDDYRQEKVTAELSRLQSFAGDYRGSIVNKDDNSSIGLIAIKLRVQSVPVSSNDNAAITAQATLAGTVTITSSITSQAVIQTASISSDNDESGAFTGKMSLALSDGTNAEMSISGTITGTQFNGEISLDKMPGVTGVFTTVKDASLPASSSSQSPGISAYDSYAGTFKRCNEGPGCDVTVTMTTHYLTAKTEDDFVRNFLRGIWVGVYLKFDFGVEPSNIAIDFPVAQLDLQSGTILAQKNYTGSVNTVITLRCVRRSAGARAEWSCEYNSSYNENARYKFILRPGV